MHGTPSSETELADRSRSFGLMQVMGETAREQGFAARYLAEMSIPVDSIEHGAKLLHSLLVRYHGDTLAAISAYNQGSARRKAGVLLNARYVYRVCCVAGVFAYIQTLTISHIGRSYGATDIEVYDIFYKRAAPPVL